MLNKLFKRKQKNLMRSSVVIVEDTVINELGLVSKEYRYPYSYCYFLDSFKAECEKYLVSLEEYNSDVIDPYIDSKTKLAIYELENQYNTNSRCILNINRKVCGEVTVLYEIMRQLEEELKETQDKLEEKGGNIHAKYE